MTSTDLKQSGSPCMNPCSSLLTRNFPRLRWLSWAFSPSADSHCCWSSFSSVQFICSVVSNSLQPHELQHARPPCPSPTPGVYPNSCPLSRWCHPAISSSVIPFSSCPKSLPASGSFPMSQLFVCGGQSIGVSASSSVLPMNTQDLSPLGWTGWIFLRSKGLSRVFSNTSLQPAKNFHHLILDCLLQNKKNKLHLFFHFPNNWNII